MSRLTPLVNLSASALRLAPPMTMPNVCWWYFKRSFATPKICKANSRVGDTIITPVPADQRWFNTHNGISNENNVLTISRLKLQSIQHFDSWNKESQRLSRSSFCSTQNITASHERRDGTSLNLCHLCESHIFDTVLCLFTAVQTFERKVKRLSIYRRPNRQ